MLKIREIFDSVLPIIEKFAPTIGEAIGGNIGFAIGYIIPILANAFDVHPYNLKSLVSTILNDPNAGDKLSTIENEHADWLGSLIDSNILSNISRADIHIKLEWAGDRTLIKGSDI